jgi:hypothetical protein
MVAWRAFLVLACACCLCEPAHSKFQSQQITAAELHHLLSLPCLGRGVSPSSSLSTDIRLLRVCCSQVASPISAASCISTIAVTKRQLRGHHSEAPLPDCVVQKQPEVVLSGTGTPSVASAPVSPNRSTIAMTAERISVSALLGPAPSAEQRQKLLLTIKGECCCWRTDAAKLGQSRQRCAYAGDMLNATALPPQLQLRLASFTCRITCCTGNVQGWGSSALDA